MWYYKYTCGIWYDEDQNHTYKFNMSVLFMCYVLQATNVAQHLSDMFNALKLHTTAEHKVVLTYNMYYPLSKLHIRWLENQWRIYSGAETFHPTNYTSSGGQPNFLGSIPWCKVASYLHPLPKIKKDWAVPPQESQGS